MSENYLTLLSKVNCLSSENKERFFKDLLNLADRNTRLRVLVKLFLLSNDNELKQALSIAKSINNLNKLSSTIDALPIPAYTQALKAIE